MVYCLFQVDKTVRYSVKVSYIEIYKEELQDLLDLETSSKDLHVREDDKGNTGTNKNSSLNEPPHGKTSYLHRRKQRRRSASQ